MFFVSLFVSLPFSWFDCRKMLTWYSSEGNRKTGHILCKTKYLIMTSMWSNYMNWKEVLMQSLQVREKNYGESSGSCTMVGSQIREGNWISILPEFTCQWSHSSCWCQSCCSLLVDILPLSKLGRNSFQVCCTGGIVIVFWRRSVQVSLFLWYQFCVTCGEYLTD
jgi:hypothetical protein